MRPLRINLLEYKSIGAERGIFPLMGTYLTEVFATQARTGQGVETVLNGKCKRYLTHSLLYRALRERLCGCATPPALAVPYRQVGLQRRRDSIVVEGLQFGSCQQRLQRGPTPFSSHSVGEGGFAAFLCAATCQYGRQGHGRATPRGGSNTAFGAARGCRAGRREKLAGRPAPAVVSENLDRHELVKDYRWQSCCCHGQHRVGVLARRTRCRTWYD